MTDIIKIHNIIESSFVNGPGNRFVIWTQGCPLKCSGCFNPVTHDMNQGENISVYKLSEQINKTENIRGVTFSGGEPLVWSEQILKLIELIRKDLDILLFSGYTLKEILSNELQKRVLYKVDAALLGRYDKNLSHPFFGKKLVLNGNRINKSEIKPYIDTEITIQDNNVQITGIYKQKDK